MSTVPGNTIRVGLAGFGFWARLCYVPLLAELPDVRVVGVAAQTESTRMAAASAFGDGITLHARYTDLIESEGLDAVLVALTPALNAVAAGAALDRGLHAFVEPPFADGPDTERMLAMAEAGRGVLHSDVEPRYLPVVQALRSLFGDGELGALRSLRLNHEMLLSSDYSERSMVFGLGPWYVDLLDAFSGSPAARVELVPDGRRDDGLLVTGEAKIEYETGVSATWHFGFEGPRELGLSVSLKGERGEAEADLTNGAYGWRRAGGNWRSAVSDCSRPEAGFIGMRESLRSFLAAVRGQGETMSGHEVIRRTQPVLLELQRQEMGLSR